MVADALPVSEVAFRSNAASGLGASRPVVPLGQRHSACRAGSGNPDGAVAADLGSGIYLADGRESKMLSGIDDHSRFAVCAAVLAVAFLRAVADTFTAVTSPLGRLPPVRCK